MSYQSMTPFTLIQERPSDEILNKVFSLSGYHLCYWVHSKETQETKSFSAYEAFDGVTFSDFNWPKKYLTQEALNYYLVRINDLVEHHKTLDIKLEFKTLGKWVRIITRYIPEKKAYEGVVRDITSEYLADLALRNRTLELSAYDEGLDQFSIVARTDAQGKILYANNEFCRLSKYSYEELLGKDHRVVNSGHHPKAFFEEMWNCIKKGVSWRGLVKNKAKDGSFYWVDTIVIPIRDEAGVLLEILSFRFDVTQMMSYQEEILRLKSEIAQLKFENKKDVIV